VPSVEVRRRQNEGDESFFRRFSRTVQQSGVLLQAKKVRFHSRKKNKRRRREEAKRRSELMKERERLIKLGEIDETADLSQVSRGVRSRR
jgi:ribosomal protein S21